MTAHDSVTEPYPTCVADAAAAKAAEDELKIPSGAGTAGLPDVNADGGGAGQKGRRWDTSALHVRRTSGQRVGRAARRHTGRDGRRSS